MFFIDVGLLFVVYLFSLVWQFIAFPWTQKLFPTLIDRGWALGRVLTTLTVSIVIFTFAMLGFSVNTNMSVFGLTFFFSIITFWFFLKQRKSLLQIERSQATVILAEESLFLVGLIFMGVMRGFSPNLDSLEKYMDFGFVNQYLLSPKLPATDMWLAGQAINYYSFGHFWASEIIRWLPVKPTTGFNVVLAIFFGLDLMLSFSIVINLVKVSFLWKKIVGGLVAAGLVCLGGNSHILWFMIKNQGLWDGDIPYWYAVATRFIEQTIHEFPSYTFTIGDLHAHLMDLPVILSFILVLVAWTKTTKEKLVDIRLEMLMGVLIGIMVMTNTWDSAIYAFLFSILVVFKTLTQKNYWRVGLRSLLIIFGIAILISSPWWWSFKPISQNISWVNLRSPFWQLAVLWSGQILFGLIAVLVNKNVVVRSLVVTALILIAIPEIIYLVDIYDNFPRANTMFKLTYQSFVMLSLLGGVAIAEALVKKSWLLCCLLLVMAAGLLVYPWTSYPNFYLNFREYQGLDGESWLARDMKDKYGAIVYLKNHRDRKNLIEYPGSSFSLSNATPVFSGVPTVLGWRDHEWLWRSDKNLIDSRVEEIKTVYEMSNSDEAKQIIEKYNIGWIIVGREERKNYAVNNWGLTQIGKIVWENGENYLIKIN